MDEKVESDGAEAHVVDKDQIRRHRIKTMKFFYFLGGQSSTTK